MSSATARASTRPLREVPRLPVDTDDTRLLDLAAHAQADSGGIDRDQVEQLAMGIEDLDLLRGKLESRLSAAWDELAAARAEIVGLRAALAEAVIERDEARTEAADTARRMATERMTHNRTRDLLDSTTTRLVTATGELSALRLRLAVEGARPDIAPDRLVVEVA